MKQNLIRVCGLLCVCVLLLGAFAGCSLTKTTRTSEVETNTSYIDGDAQTTGTTAANGDNKTPGNNGNKTPATPGNNGNKTPATPGNVVNGGGDNSSHDAGTVDNTTEEKLTGTLELQIFVGGYGETVSYTHLQCVGAVSR